MSLAATAADMGGRNMPKYLVEASYTSEGLKNLQKDRAEGRTAAIKAAVQSIGGKVEVLYWALGEYDAVIVVELPDTSSAAALALAASASGMVRTKTTQLLTAAEVDAALAKAIKYRPPGQ
jgi:uncharacterized protein with GYD domain